MAGVVSTSVMVPNQLLVVMGYLLAKVELKLPDLGMDFDFRVAAEQVKPILVALQKGSIILCFIKALLQTDFVTQQVHHQMDFKLHCHYFVVAIELGFASD